VQARLRSSRNVGEGEPLEVRRAAVELLAPPPPKILSQPIDVTVQAGQPVHLSVTARVRSNALQWWQSSRRAWHRHSVQLRRTCSGVLLRARPTLC